MLSILLVTLALTGLANCKPQNVGWWKDAVIYEVYPRSFQSADNNPAGTGDLNGIAQHLDYIKDMGFGAIWLNPIYESKSNVDAGYDISDFKGIDPIFGNMETFRNLTKACKEKGIKVIMDYVPNHSSNMHPWFLKSIEKDQKYSTYYVWHDGKMLPNKTRVPPNNWYANSASVSAWEWNDKRQQYYLHQFLIEQPDLNYTNPEVLQEMQDVLTFWMDQGVDGFRMDAVFAIIEDPQFRDEPPAKGVKNPTNYGELNHIYTAELQGTYDVLRKFRETLDEFTSKKDDNEKIMFTESYVWNLELVRKYYGTPKEPIAHFPFNFALIMNTSKSSNGKQWANAINTWFKNIDQDKYWPNWVIGNHDQFRVSTRYSPEQTDLIHIIMMTLRGTVFIYAGDELAMEDSFVRQDQGQDVTGLRAPPGQFFQRSRDPERGPMPWNDTDNGGFSKVRPWLPLTSDPSVTVKAQQEAKKSHLKTLKRLVELKKKKIITMGDTLVEPLNKTMDDVLVITRSLPDNPTVISVLNFGIHSVAIDLIKYRKTLPDEMYVYTSSVNTPFNEGDEIKVDSIWLPPVSGIVLTSIKSIR